MPAAGADMCPGAYRCRDLLVLVVAPTHHFSCCAERTGVDATHAQADELTLGSVIDLPIGVFSPAMNLSFQVEAAGKIGVTGGHFTTLHPVSAQCNALELHVRRGGRSTPAGDFGVEPDATGLKCARRDAGKATTRWAGLARGVISPAGGLTYAAQGTAMTKSRTDAPWYLGLEVSGLACIRRFVPAR